MSDTAGAGDGFDVRLFAGLGEQAEITHRTCGATVTLCNPTQARLAWFKANHGCGGPDWYGPA